MVVTVLVAPFLPPLFLRLRVVNAHCSKQLPPLDRVVHHGLVRLLFLPLDRQKWIFPDLRRHIPWVVDRRAGRESLLAGLFGKILDLVVLQQLVDAALSEEIGLALCSPGLPVRRTRVHPLNPVNLALSTRGLQRFLNLLLAALLIDLLEALLQFLPLGDRLGFRLLCGSDIPRPLGMPTLLHVQIAGTHLGGGVAARPWSSLMAIVRQLL